MRHRTTITGSLIVLVSLFLADGYAEPPGAEPDAEAILTKVRQTYSGLRGYHFEHTLVVEEVKKGQKPAKVAEISLVTASEKDKGQPRVFEGERPVDYWADAQTAKQIPHNLDRCRFAVKHARGDVVLACNEKTRWMYVGELKEYKRGDRLPIGPTAATMYAALHLTPLTKFVDESLTSSKLVGEEEIEVGSKRRICYVLECTLKAPLLTVPAGSELPDSLKSSNPFAGATGILMLLQINGYFDGLGRGMYLPVDKPDPPQITLWVDTKDAIVWRSKLVEKAQVTSLQAPQEPKAEPVEVQVTDNFSVAKINTPLSDELFQFTPPEDAKEVREFTEQRPSAKEVKK